jgi:hypothetical protein
MNSIAVPIIMLILGVGIGFALGLFVTSLRGEQDDKSESMISPQDNYEEVGRLWQDERGELLVKMDGKVIASPADLDTQQRQRLSKSMKQLWLWGGGQPASTDRQGAQGVPLVDRELPLKSPEPDESTKSEGRRINPFNIFANALRADIPEIPEQSPSISTQIDEILQEMLAGTTLEQRGIRLMELQDQGVVVMVGLDKYPDIASVPDADIRTVIDAAVKEWEKRNWKD